MKKGIIAVVIIVLVILVGIGVYFLIQDKASEEFVTSIPSSNNANVSYSNLNTVTPEENEYYKTPEGYAEYQKLIQKRTIDKVTMTLKEGTLTKTGATFTITDKNEAPYGYGEEFCIEQNKDNKWERVQGGEAIFTAIGWVVGKDQKIEFKTDWSTIYGELQQGKYRLVKRAGNQNIYAEFTIQ